jgi:hypothetical protein
MTIGSDAERLSAINELNQAIAAREPQKKAALTELDKAKQLENERKKAVKATEARVTAVGVEVHRRCHAVYLNGKSLDRGTVQVGNELLRFSGWHGNIDVSLASIDSFELGNSKLPPRAGMPLLDRVWPGTPRAATTLLLTLQEKDSNQTSRVVLADLSDGAALQTEIEGRKAKLGDVTAHRMDLESQGHAALASLAEATQGVIQAKAHVDAVEAEIAPYRRQRDQLIAQQRQIDAERARAARAVQDAARREAQQAAATKGGKKR